MSIVDAISSGRRIKRKHWTQYCENQETWFRREDILANDWEVEEHSVTVTLGGLFEAYNQALIDSKIKDTDQMDEVFNSMVRMMGL